MHDTKYKNHYEKRELLILWKERIVNVLVDNLVTGQIFCTDKQYQNSKQGENKG